LVSRIDFLKKGFFKALVFIECTQWQCILSYDNSTALYQFLKFSIVYFVFLTNRRSTNFWLIHK
jgi:hypothetical protein